MNPSNIYYTAISGIWQTVWLEPVNNDYIENIEINNDFDNKEIKINLILNSKKQLLISLTLEYNGKSIKFINGHSNTNMLLLLNWKKMNFMNGLPLHQIYIGLKQNYLKKKIN